MPRLTFWGNRQVQDLEKQLHAARQQVTQLKSLVKPDNYSAVSDDEPTHQSPHKRRKLTAAYDFNTIHRNMENYGRGLISAPRHVEGSGTLGGGGSGGGGGSPAEAGHGKLELVDLPPVQRGEQLLADYHATVHQVYPFINWASLQANFDRAYREGIDRLPTDARAVLLGVLACGALRENHEHGRPYQEAARASISFWMAAPTMDLIRASMLSFVFLVETNRTSTAFIMIGAAMRAAQELGLHHKTVIRSAAEEESRYNLWWSLYCLERCVAGLPLPLE